MSDGRVSDSEGECVTSDSEVECVTMRESE